MYEFAQEADIEYVSYGLSSWFEFCKFGTPVPHDWTLETRDTYGGVLFATSPDKSKTVLFG